ncbi:MAG: endo alpha-1,4 polygalactosaminidase [Vulcanimicrobiaceae bacterium]
MPASQTFGSGALSLLLTLTACSGGNSATGASLASVASPAPYWIPATAATFQIQFTGTFDPRVVADVYDLDGFATPASTVASLHAAGRHVLCYIDAGSYETYRPDASAFPSAVIGASYAGYPDEKWLDIRRIATLAPIMKKRLDLCKRKGFDAIEPDNIDGYQNNTGFPLTAKDQIAYNTWFAGQAHARHLAIGLKNDGDQAKALRPSFDFVVAEDCWKQAACGAYKSFVTAGRAVFAIEYTDVTARATFQHAYCLRARAAGMFVLLKTRKLDASREVCSF